jgi:hypothetical protein
MIEMGEDVNLNEGGAAKYDLRAGTLSWSGGILKTGKTIFPGYAINIETGERLNIIVSEDSYQIGQNGRDMKWNPTDFTGTYNSNYPSYGGRQYIYIMGSEKGPLSTIAKGPIYDKGETYHNILSGSSPARNLRITQVFHNCQWVVPTYLSAGFEMVDGPDGIPMPVTDFRLQLRVSKPYTYFEPTAAENNGNPKYIFNTADIYNEISEQSGKNAIELINIVPNPYYAFSGYESSPIENKVKFTNLPQKCDISIYTLDGSLVRRIRKDDDKSEAVWDLKNSAGVPIASGLYIIHVDAGELGEKVLKWMGIMRELDLDSF